MSNPRTVVGLGGSAGAIGALRQFFQHMPSDTGMCFVVIVHLSPDHESRLAEVLQSATAMPVLQVTESVRVAADQVYVIPPNRSLSMVDGHLALSEVTRIEERRAPIDIFFRTLGETHHSRAIGVVLSGTGADGSMGLKRIKENGGLCFAQHPQDAEYGDMPRHAIGTGLVDDVLSAGDLAAKIVASTQQLDTVAVVEDAPAGSEVDEAALRDVLTQVRVGTGHDFSNYKRPTLLRRIARRMTVTEVPDLAAYAAFLREHPPELQALLKDVLISVTHFFRDRQAFDALEARVIPQFFEGRGEDDHVRAWVAGCATGEEAYSIAMLLSEFATSLPAPPALQVFATDIDGASIAFARQGVYTLNDAADVSPGRLQRFFVKEGETYRVHPQLRELVLFSRHDVLKDPPFSQLDLLSCRNVLIYLNRTAQRRVMEVAHFALRPRRFLFLGSSESVDASADLFTPFEKEVFLFQSQSLPNRRELPVPRARGTLSLARLAPSPQPFVMTPPRAPTISVDVHLRLLERYAPPSIVVSADHDILHLSPTAGQYLQLPGGGASLNLLKVVRPELRVDLASALYQASQQRTPVEVHDLQLPLADRTAALTLIVEPVSAVDSDVPEVLLVIFREASRTESLAPPESVTVTTRDTARVLDEEVTRLRTQLRSAIERHDVRVEEHKAVLEEQQAMNEELRSSGEELETSREELQSLNEELHTVNQELRIKVEEQARANDDMHNLVSATEIGTVFLDRFLRIKMFTPSIRSVFNLLPSDRGRPLSDITTLLADGNDDLQQDVEQVLSALNRVEREVQTRDGRWLMMRAFPYRTADDRIDGVVLTFVDVTEGKRARALVQASEERLRRATEVGNVGVMFFAPDGVITHANDAFLRLAGRTPEELQRGILRRDNFPTTSTDAASAVHEISPGVRTTTFEREFVHADGHRSWGLCAATQLKPDEGVEFVVDISQTKQIADQLRRSEARLRLMVESVTEYAIFTLDRQGRVDSWNPGAARMFGYAEEEIVGQSFGLMFTPEDRAAGADREELRLSRETGHASDERWHLRKDGTRFYVSGATASLLSAQNEVIGYVKVARDLTDRKSAEEALTEAHAALEVRVQERTAELATANRRLAAEVDSHREAENKIRELLGRMMSIQEDERRRISRDLHDQAGQQIVALKLKLEALEEDTSGDMEARKIQIRERIESAKALIARLDRDIDFFTWELRPPALDEFGLVAALERFAAEWSGIFGIPADFQEHGLGRDRMRRDVETNLYRIVQEALNNAQKHSGATVVSITLSRLDSEVVLMIEDDGHGFDPKTGGTSGTLGIGLLGMRERTSLMGGLFAVESAPGKGTSVLVRVPARPDQ